MNAPTSFAGRGAAPFLWCAPVMPMRFANRYNRSLIASRPPFSVHRCNRMPSLRQHSLPIAFGLLPPHLPVLSPPSQRLIVSLPHRFASRPPSIRLLTGHKRSPHAPISVRSLFVHPPVITARSSLPAPLSPSTDATACPRYVNTVYQSHLVCFPRIYQFLVHPSQRPIVSLPHRFASRPPSIRLLT